MFMNTFMIIKIPHNTPEVSNRLRNFREQVHHEADRMQENTYIQYRVWYHFHGTSVDYPHEIFRVMK